MEEKQVDGFIYAKNLIVGMSFFSETFNDVAVVKTINFQEDGAVSIGVLINKEIKIEVYPGNKELLLTSNSNHDGKPANGNNMLSGEKKVNKTSSNINDLHWARREPFLASESLTTLIRFYFFFWISSTISIIILFWIIEPLLLLITPFYFFLSYIPLVYLRVHRTFIYSKEIIINDFKSRDKKQV
ncbi:MAG: hypothetical protein RBQ97_09900 [Acholeplasma sp.]|nr:hypothetical protein [Acholeplasma sp.]